MVAQARIGRSKSGHEIVLRRHRTVSYRTKVRGVPRMSTVHVLYLVPLIIATAAIGFAQDKTSSADRSISGPAAQPPAAPAENNLLDKILVMVGPADPAPLTKKQAFD